MRQRILELVWQGVVRPMTVTESSRLRRVFKAMLPMRIVCLAASSGITRIAVLSDELEVMPALPLGDVIVEELGVDVPYGSLLVLCDEDTVGQPMAYEDLSFDMGVAVGKVLLTVLRRGIFPLERENEALYTMACAYDRMARTTAMQNLGLIPGEFSKALAGTLGSYWAGSRLIPQGQCGLIPDGGYLASPELRQYLMMLDPGFAAPAYGQVPSGLLAFAGGPRSFPEWLEHVRDAVNGVLGERRHRLIRS